MTTLVRSNDFRNQLMDMYPLNIRHMIATSLDKPHHPFLSGANIGEAAVGCVAIAAGIVTLVMAGGMLSAWISLAFAITTTAIAAMSAYHLWFGS